MFVDELHVHIKAGDGGNGVVRWHREKFRPKGGPSGGDGGNGGDVYIRAVRDLTILQRYAHVKNLSAESGEEGGAWSKHGADGADLYVDLPIGAKVTNRTTGEVFQLTYAGQTEQILEGGDGGIGNERFKSSRNQTPEEWTPGTPGEEADFHIELELIADIGLVGLPSAGKSTLITELTNAKSKVAPYQFTTLSPHLGDLYGYIIADIPGLIEGASQGRGLGYSFLRHIKKTALLLHCISLESDDCVRDYKTIRNELNQYDPSLTDKQECFVLTKKDLVDDSTRQDVEQALRQYATNVYSVSVDDEMSLKALTDHVIKHVRELTGPSNTSDKNGGISGN